MHRNQNDLLGLEGAICVFDIAFCSVFLFPRTNSFYMTVNTIPLYEQAPSVLEFQSNGYT